MIPVVIVVFIIMGLPFIRAIYWSFTDKVIGAEANFIGFDNYIKLFSDKIYWKSLTNTLVYTVVCIVAKLLIGLLWAVLLNQNFKGKGFFRTALLIPWALPGMVAAMTWRWMYDSTYGIINSLLMDMGIIDLPIAWLSNPKIVLFSAIIVNIWRGVPFFMFSILGELQTLDRQVYEAATVDGAGIFKQFWYITLPSIMPSVITLTLLNIGRIFYSDFGLFYQVTQNSGQLYDTTNVIDTYVYRALLQSGNIGMASAAGFYQSIVGFACVLLANVVVRKLSPENAMF